MIKKDLIKILDANYSSQNIIEEHNQIKLKKEWVNTGYEMETRILEGIIASNYQEHKGIRRIKHELNPRTLKARYELFTLKLALNFPKIYETITKIGIPGYQERWA